MLKVKCSSLCWCDDIAAESALEEPCVHESGESKHWTPFRQLPDPFLL